MAVYRTSINGSAISIHIVKVCRRVEVLLHTFLPLSLDGGELSASRLPQDLPLPVMHEAFSQARLVRGEISLVILLGLEPRDFAGSRTAPYLFMNSSVQQVKYSLY
jgi:hypothetical protein